MIDYKVKRIQNGYDVELPLAKISNKDDLLFQQVELLLDTWLGEFVYDVSLGIDYKSFLGNEIDLTNIERTYYDKISKLLYFGKMENFKIDIDRNNRKLKISFDIVSVNESTQTFNQTI